MVICLEQGADLHMAQLIPLPLTVSCFSKIQIGFTFLVVAHPGSPGKRAIKRVCVCVCWHRCKMAVTWLYATLLISICSLYRGQGGDVNIWSILLIIRLYCHQISNSCSGCLTQ